jgi:hypothetical protein
MTTTDLSRWAELVKPEVLGPDGETITDDNPLDPCPHCNAVPGDAPEGIHSEHTARKHHAVVGSAVWNFEHCWRCGYRPGINVAVSNEQMRVAFDRFKAMMAQEYDKLMQEKAKGITPPDTTEVDALRQQLIEAQDREVALRSQLSPPPEA